MGNTMACSRCYNKKCNNVFEQTKMMCPFSDTCPEFMAVGFGSAKKKTNFDHIREDMTIEEFINIFSKMACPPNVGNCELARDIQYKTCQSCWRKWLESEYHISLMNEN